MREGEHKAPVAVHGRGECRVMVVVGGRGTAQRDGSCCAQEAESLHLHALGGQCRAPATVGGRRIASGWG